MLAELLSELSRHARRHPWNFIAIGIAGSLAAARILWLFVWWLLFAPATWLAIEGRVACDGVPVQEGNICFEPLKTRGVASRTARISSGSFSIPRAHGVAQNTEYLVRVEGFRKTGNTYPGVKPGEFSEELEQFVLPEFNRDSQTRVKMSRDVLLEGISLNVQGLPLSNKKKQVESGSAVQER